MLRKVLDELMDETPDDLLAKSVNPKSSVMNILLLLICNTKLSFHKCLQQGDLVL